jgi:hypothetical protein
MKTKHMNDQMAKRKRDRERGVGEVAVSVEGDNIPEESEQQSTNTATLEETVPEVTDVNDIVADAEMVINTPTPIHSVAKRRSESVVSTRSAKRSRSSQPITTQPSATTAITQGVETLAGAFTRGMEGFGGEIRSALVGSTSRVAELSGQIDELRANQEGMRAELRKAHDEQKATNPPYETTNDWKVDDPLRWWIDHQADYPILAKMAFDLFSVPAMSAECERIFSQAKKVITDERNRINSDTVAAIECQKHLLRTGILDSE